MAFNLQTFKTRSLTAILFVIVMISGLLWNHWSFFLLFSIIHFGCWLEFTKLSGIIESSYKDTTPFHKWGVIVAGWCLMLYFTSEAFDLFGVKLHQIGWWMGMIFIFALPLMEFLFEDKIRLKNIYISILGLIYISLSWSLMIDLFNFPHISVSGFAVPTIPLLVIFSIWINDTMAYISGSLFGKTPLSRISPKKTWEGTLIGIILSVALIGTLAAKLIADQLPVASYHWYIIAAIAAIAGTFGDLLESKLKRMAGVKDSGSIMPGHGGFLDRFDSMLVATPIVWLYVVLVLSLNQ
jgi:phosphatidate cytidylyltransferase